MPLDLTDDKSILVLVMAWCHQATSHYLSQCWPRSILPNGITRPQWVKMGGYPQFQGLWFCCHSSWAHVTSGNFYHFPKATDSPLHHQTRCLLSWGMCKEYVKESGSGWPWISLFQSGIPRSYRSLNVIHCDNKSKELAWCGYNILLGLDSCVYTIVILTIFETLRPIQYDR